MSLTYDTLKRRVMGRIGKGLAEQTTDEELGQAINGAIDEVTNEMPYHLAADETISLSEDTYEYDISALSFAYIHRITMADADGDFPVVNVIPAWQYNFDTGPTLKFDERMWTPMDSRALRIEGQGFQANLSSGSDVCYISDAYVIAKAAAELLGNLGSPREPIMERKAESARWRSSFVPYPDAKRVRS